MASIKQRISDISSELRIKKEGTNEFAKYDYFRPDDILLALTPLLKKNDLFIHFDMPYVKEVEMYRGTLSIIDIIDEQNSEIYLFDIPLTQVKGAGQAQNAGATMTYCKRYMIMNAFNIADNEADPDNKKNKPASSEGNKRQTLEETLKMIDETQDIETLKKWDTKIKDSKVWTDVQKRVIAGRILNRVEELQSLDNLSGKKK